MRGFLTHRRALAIVVTLLLLSCVLPTRFAAAAARVPGRVVQVVATPLQWPLSLAGSALRGAGNARPPLQMPETQFEERLAAELVYSRQLEERLRIAEERLAMITQAQEIGLTGATNIEARVTGVAGDPTRRVLLIDKGSARGVSPDAPVVYGASLVGRVQDVSPATARVELITAAGARIFVRLAPPVAEPGARQIREQAVRSDQGAWFVAQVDTRAPVEVGDWATLADELWPSEALGYVVGTVTRVEKDDRDPLRFKRVIIEPIPLTQLRSVVVRVPVQQGQ